MLMVGDVHACMRVCVQVVDGNFGIHTVIPKWPFSNTTEQFSPTTMAGTSKPAEVTLMTAL